MEFQTSALTGNAALSIDIWFCRTILKPRTFFELKCLCELPFSSGANDMRYNVKSTDDKGETVTYF